jgi:hypothetical protein
LPRIREALFSETYDGRKNPFNTGLQRQMMWTIFLMQHASIARASLFSDFCPNIEGLSLPVEDHQWDTDGMPQFVLLRLERWKGNEGRLKQARARGLAPARGSAAAGGTASCATHTPTRHHALSGLVDRLHSHAHNSVCAQRHLQTLYIERNVVDPKFCPVLALLSWLKEADIKYGPIFPASTRRTARSTPARACPARRTSAGRSSCLSTWVAA